MIGPAWWIRLRLLSFPISAMDCTAVSLLTETNKLNDDVIALHGKMSIKIECTIHVTVQYGVCYGIKVNANL
jgi:hypothetical protein